MSLMNKINGLLSVPSEIVAEIKKLNGSFEAIIKHISVLSQAVRELQEMSIQQQTLLEELLYTINQDIEEFEREQEEFFGVSNDGRPIKKEELN